jgi:hypothetical protein
MIVCRTVYGESSNKDLDFVAEPRRGQAGSSVERRTANRPPKRPGCSIDERIQNIMVAGRAVGKSIIGALISKSLGRCLRGVAGVSGRAIFQLPLAHRRFSVKGRYSSSSDDEMAG